MTEAEWNACDDPWKLFAEIDWQGSERKVRLFGGAFFRGLGYLAGDDMTRQAIEVASRYADGQATEALARQAGRFMDVDERVDFTVHLSEQQDCLLRSACSMCLPYEHKARVQG